MSKSILCFLFVVLWSVSGAFITRHPDRKCHKEWILVFRGVPGNSRSIYSTWCTRSRYPCTFSRGCLPKGTNFNLLYGSGKQHLRSQLIDEWTKLGIKEVKLALYKDGQEVAYMVFNGKGTSFTNWFSSSRLIETSWFDLFSDNYFDAFTISGSRGKTFVVNQNNGYTSCTGHRRGWFQITDSNLHSKYSCGIERRYGYPAFFYSKRNHKGRIAYGEYDRAHAMGIFIKLS